MATQSSQAVIAGPRDRESFFEAQRRNRRATWRLSAVCVLATVVMGIPLALTITPLLYAAALLITDIVNIWTPLPASFWQHANELARYGFLAIGWLTQQSKTTNPQALAIGAAVLLVPGAMLSIALWFGVDALFRRAGVGGALLALRAREPNSSELKELRLTDVVQEMAIAAGLPAPKIMLIDTPAANAAAIGTSPNDARIVVTRGLLERLNRDELEGALAHLLASIGNGDLRIAFRVASVFETYGLLLALINSPFGPRARRTLWRIVRFGLIGKKQSEASAEEAAAIAALLSRSAGLDSDDIDDVFNTTRSKKSVLRSIRNFLLFPIFLTNFAIKLSLWFFSFSMLEPGMALLWRKRVYLADAAAVQLTRSPDGLAEALHKLNGERAPIPGGAWAPHLFLQDGTRAGAVDLQGITSVGSPTTFQIQLSAAPGSGSPIVTQVLTFNGSVQDIANLQQLGLITDTGLAQCLTSLLQNAQTAYQSQDYGTMSRLLNSLVAALQTPPAGISPLGVQVLRQEAESLLSLAPTAPIYPMANCVTNNGNGTYTASFGYENDNSVPVTIPVGNSNFLSPAGQSQTPITSFNPGQLFSPFQNQGAFSVTFNGSNLFWTVQGPDGVYRTATGSANSPVCQNPGS